MPLPSRLLHEFMASLAGKAETTMDTYHRELRHFLTWLAQRPGNRGSFSAARQLTRTALETYLAYLQGQGHSLSHCARVKSVVTLLVKSKPLALELDRRD
jgi:site-specific recombinase XerD